MSDRGLMRFAVWSVLGDEAPTDEFMYLYAHVAYDKIYSTGTFSGGSLAFSTFDLIKHDDAHITGPAGDPNVNQFSFPPGGYHITLQIYPYTPGHPSLSSSASRTARIVLLYPGSGTTVLATATGAVPRSGGWLSTSCDYATADSAGFAIEVDLTWAVDSPGQNLYFGRSPGQDFTDQSIFPIDSLAWNLVVEGIRSDI